MILVIEILYCSPVVKPPKIIAQPQPLTFQLGETATFTCHATGYNVKYKWSSASGEFSSRMSGIDTDTLKIRDVRLSDANSYTCTISNDGAIIRSDSVKLTVVGKKKC